MRRGASGARADVEAAAIPRVVAAPTIKPTVANDNRASLAYFARRWAAPAILALMAAAVLAVVLG